MVMLTFHWGRPDEGIGPYNSTEPSVAMVGTVLPDGPPSTARPGGVIPTHKVVRPLR